MYQKEYLTWDPPFEEEVGPLPVQFDLPQGRLKVSMLIDKAVYVSKVGKLIKAAVKSDKPPNSHGV